MYLVILIILFVTTTFVLCYTYGVPSDNHQFTMGLTVLYRLWHYKNVLRGIIVTP